MGDTLEEERENELLFRSGMVALTYNPSTWETETGRLQILVQKKLAEF